MKTEIGFSVTLLLLSLLQPTYIFATGHTCQHQAMVKGSNIYQYDHLEQAQTSHLDKKRLLQSSDRKNIRIYLDYSQTKLGLSSERNAIKKLMEISSYFLHQLLKVNRLDKLFGPSSSDTVCNNESNVIIPGKYGKNGVNADLGIMVANEDFDRLTYVARSAPCVLQKSDKRPIWGIVIWNNPKLPNNQVDFQKIVYVALHQICHIIAISPALFENYPSGNPIKQIDGLYYFQSNQTNQVVQDHFKCSNHDGILLEDQDGTIISSHLERKVFGSQFMTASGKKGSFISKFVVAMLDSTGWYDADYNLAEPTSWGAGEGCDFLDIDNCEFEQFCKLSSFTTTLCDWDSTAYGLCAVDSFSNTCPTRKYAINYVCTDPAYTLNNQVRQTGTYEQSNQFSRCFRGTIISSDYQGPSADFPNRCYKTVCSSTSSFIFIIIKTSIFLCRSPGSIIRAPGGTTGLDGFLICPEMAFTDFCSVKKNCLNNCNQNGICVNGQCLCRNYQITNLNSVQVMTIDGIGWSQQLTSSCPSQVDLATNSRKNHEIKGVLKSRRDRIRDILIDDGDVITLINRSPNNGTTYSRNNRGNSLDAKQKDLQITITGLSLNQICMPGSYFDRDFNECCSCMDNFGCQTCDGSGCLDCPNQQPPINGKCLSAIVGSITKSKRYAK